MYNTYILYVYLCVCVCMCVYVICRPIAIVSTDIFLRELLYTFFLQKPNPPPHPPPFLSTGSIRHLVFSTSLTTRENERIIGQGTRVRSHMAPRFFQTFHPIPPPLPLFLEKKIARKLPIEERSRPWENVPLFLFFLFFLTFFYTFDQRYKEKKKKRRIDERNFLNSFDRKIGRKRIQKSENEECNRRESAIGRQSCNRFYLFYFGRLRIVHRYTSIYRLHLTHATYT